MERKNNKYFVVYDETTANVLKGATEQKMKIIELLESGEKNE